MADPWLIAICAAGAAALWVWRRRTSAVAAAVVAAIAAFLALKGCADGHRRAAVDCRNERRHDRPSRRGRVVEFPDGVGGIRPHAARASKVARRCSRRSRDVVTLATRCTPTRRLSTRRDRSTPSGIFSRTHQLGFAVATALENGETRVLWSDIRYCWAGSGVTTETDDGTPVACALWFGGTFDRDGRPLTQIVRVGQWLQTRPAGPVRRNR